MMTQNFNPKFLILHYTELNFGESMDILQAGDVSVHYLIPTTKYLDPSYDLDEIKIHSLVDEDLIAWHAGKSSWKGFDAMNNHSIGIEIVNLGVKNAFEPYPKEQIDKIVELSLNIMDRYDIIAERVIGHSDISPGRKIDPGPNFPWEELSKYGVGAWYDEDIKDKYLKEFKESMPNIEDIMRKLREYGYTYLASERDIISAFQMHFRAMKYDGNMDLETAAIIYSLNKKYI